MSAKPMCISKTYGNVAEYSTTRPGAPRRLRYCERCMSCWSRVAEVMGLGTASLSIQRLPSQPAAPIARHIELDD